MKINQNYALSKTYYSLKKKWLISVLLFLFSFSTSQARDTIYQISKDAFYSLEKNKLKHIEKLIDSIGIAAPIPNEILVKHAAYVASYNPTHRIPNYVVHVIPKDVLYGSVKRTNDFRIDPLLKIPMADSSDYWNSGYDRGHMAASADFRWSYKAISESFYYTNIIPQNKELNQGAWNKLEMQIREWTIDNDELVVVTGPVIKDNLPKIQQGSHQVSIPQYIYKIVLDYYPPTYKAIAFLYPNKDVPYELEKHVVSIDSIEHLTGIDFFPNLKDSLEDELEAEHDLLAFDSGYFKHQEDSKFQIIDFGKGKINTTQVNDYIGKNTCVCGRVVDTKYNQNGKSNITYINLDKKYPNQIFTVIIFGKDRSNFPYQPELFLRNKTICVKGKITEFKGAPQIIANEAKQFEIIKK
ncbi:MAG: DNA/RNA non-specific endonuclease [Bacteroidetes bacterium]|nr:DNA/RNA non-specific endonuclease [Bacteroidota bacterium]